MMVEERWGKYLQSGMMKLFKNFEMFEIRENVDIFEIIKVE